MESLLNSNPLKSAKDFVNSTNGKITISSISLIIIFIVAIAINNQLQESSVEVEQMFKTENIDIDELKEELKEGLLSLAFHPVGGFGRYFMAEQPMNFIHGTTFCQERFGSHVLEFEEATSKSQVALKINALKRKFGENAKNEVFIGLTDVEKEGVWKWLTSGNTLPTVSPSFWSLNHPENMEDCAFINFDEKIPGYKDTSCNSHYTIICELALNDQDDGQDRNYG